MSSYLFILFFLNNLPVPIASSYCNTCCQQVPDVAFVLVLSGRMACWWWKSKRNWCGETQLRSSRGAAKEGGHLLPRRHPPQTLSGSIVQKHLDSLEFLLTDISEGRRWVHRRRLWFLLDRNPAPYLGLRWWNDRADNSGQEGQLHVMRVLSTWTKYSSSRIIYL